METELPTKVMLRQTLVLMQMPFLNNVRKVGRLVLSRTSCFRMNSSIKFLTTFSVAQHDVTHHPAYQPELLSSRMVILTA
jgi:hypothetical protein